MQAQRHLLEGGRWHFQHGPIDLVIAAEGEAAAVAGAHRTAWARFEGLLAELVAELPQLRAPIASPDAVCLVRGPVARRMWLACRPFAESFISPMAAVAGAVAQEIVACYDRAGIRRAWVNNGGDIALHLSPGAAVRVGLFSDLARLDAAQLADGLALDGCFDVTHAMPVRGVATSGWRGRSFSLGIADSVTVLAATAAEADAAATVIANAVDAADARVLRRPARELKDDSDLGDIAVTVEVPELPASLVRAAVDAGLRCARVLQGQLRIRAAVIACQRQYGVVREPSAARRVPAGDAKTIDELMAMEACE